MSKNLTSRASSSLSGKPVIESIPQEDLGKVICNYGSECNHVGTIARCYTPKGEQCPYNAQNDKGKKIYTGTNRVF